MNEINEKNEITEIKKKTYKTIDIILFSSTKLITIITLFFTSRVIIFYETEVLFNPVLFSALMIIFTIWDSINDPMMGSIGDKKFKFTSKWGKRYPWIIIGLGILIVSFPLIFFPPAISDWGLFFYLLAIMFVFEGAYTMVSSSHRALLIVKFPADKERRKSASIGEIIRMLSVVIALIGTPFLITNGEPKSYFIAACILSGFMLIIFLIQIKYSKEGPELIAQYRNEPETSLNKNFKLAVKTIIRDKPFIGIILMNMGTVLWDTFFISSIPYFIKYIALADPDLEIVLYIPYILAALIFAPISSALCKKFSKKVIYIVSILLISIPTFLIIFIHEIGIYIIIISAIVGAGTTLLNVVLFLMTLDIFDNLAKKTHIRQEGFYNGIIDFVVRLVSLIQVPIFLLIHNLTGFIPDQLNQTDKAKFGILIHLGIIPAVVNLGFGLIGYYIYKQKNKQEIEEM